MFYQGEEEVTPVAGLGALCQAPYSTVYQVQGLEEGEELRGLSEEEIDGALGLASYIGEVRQGPDGQLYEWVQTVDGLGNPIGFWKKIRKVARAVARPVVRAAAPVVRAATGVAKSAFRLLSKPWCIPLQPVRAPIGLIARRLCPIVQQPVVRRIAPLVPQVGPMIQATDRLCNLVRDCGIAGTEGGLMQAPDGTFYQVQGLAEYVGVTGAVALLDPEREWVVQIHSGSARPGSGYAIHNSSAGAYVLTSRHLVANQVRDANGRIVGFERALNVRVKLLGKSFPVVTRWYSPKPDMPDIALVRIGRRLPLADRYGPRSLRAGNFHDLDGAPVRVAGYGADGTALGRLRVGRFVGSSYYEEGHFMKLAPRRGSQGIAVITGGDSGGPVIDEQGRLAGLVFQGPPRVAKKRGWGFAVVVDDWVKGWLKRIGVPFGVA